MDFVTEDLKAFVVELAEEAHHFKAFNHLFFSCYPKNIGGSMVIVPANENIGGSMVIVPANKNIGGSMVVVPANKNIGGSMVIVPANNITLPMWFL